MSSVEQHDVRRTFLDHVGRIRIVERGGANWIYVGSIGDGGVDDLLGPISPPFQNGWTNSLGDDAPVSFTLVNGWVHIRGGFSGGADGTVVFTLPDGYRPAYQVPMVIPTGDPGHYATVIVGTNGDVVFGTTV